MDGLYKELTLEHVLSIFGSGRRERAMATVADNDVEEASPAAVTNDQLSGKSWEPAADGATGSRENNPNNCTELQTFPSKSVAGEILQVQQSSCISV